jgi:hypothetical protein
MVMAGAMLGIRRREPGTLGRVGPMTELAVRRRRDVRDVRGERDGVAPHWRGPRGHGEIAGHHGRSRAEGPVTRCSRIVDHTMSVQIASFAHGPWHESFTTTNPGRNQA